MLSAATKWIAENNGNIGEILDPPDPYATKGQAMEHEEKRSQNDFVSALREADQDSELTQHLEAMDFQTLLEFAKNNCGGPSTLLGKIQVRIREVHILKLRQVDNQSFEQIAKHPLVKMHPQAVRQAYYRMLNRFVDPVDVAEHLRRSLTRLDQVGEIAFGLVDESKPVASTMALNTVINVENRRAKLLGLDAPKAVAGADNASARSGLKVAIPLTSDELKAIQQTDPVKKPIEGALIDQESALPDSDPYMLNQNHSVETTSTNVTELTQEQIEQAKRAKDEFEANHRVIERENNQNAQPKRGTFEVAGA